MKVPPIVLALAVVDAGEKKVPPRHPSARLRTLRRFALQWLSDNFKNKEEGQKQKGDEGYPGYIYGIRQHNRYAKRFNDENWGGRLAGLIDTKCFFYDKDSTHGGPNPNGRRRRSLPADEGGEDDYDFTDDLIRYDTKNPLRGLRQITTGFRKWAERYIAECPGQKNKNHSGRANELYKKIKESLQNHIKKNEKV